MSVTSQPEPAGAHCPHAGSKFTSVSGDTYACNGADGVGGGPTGQDATTIVGSGSTVLTAGGGFTLVQNLSETVNVPANAVLYVSTDGSVTTGSSAPNGFSRVEVLIRLDGLYVAHRILDIENNGVVGNSIGTWAMAITASPAPGNHTIAVYAHRHPTFGSDALIDNSADGAVLNVLTIAK